MRSVLLAAVAGTLAGCSSGATETVPPQMLDTDPNERGKPVTLFRGCRATHQTGDVDTVSCTSYDVEVRRTAETSFEPLLDRHIEEQVYRPAASQELDTKVATYQLHVRDEAFPGRSYRRALKVEGAAADLGFIVVGVDGGGVTRVVVCSGKETPGGQQHLDSECKSAMIYILTHGIPRELFAPAAGS